MGYLSAIMDERRRDIRAERELVPLETLQEMALERNDYRDFGSALHCGRPAIIAEIKRRSPSAGPIAPRCDVAEVAADFERGGAAAISVLTESRRFGGTFLDLTRVRRACSLPVLCKDFIVDDFHLWKAVAFGADAVLLIAAMLDDARLHTLLALSAVLHVAAVVEVHDEVEAARAVSLGSEIVGINNRHLQTFQVDVGTAQRLCAVIPEGLLIVAESGYTTAEQLHEVACRGAHGVLVGEHLMRDPHRADAVRRLRATNV
jgi:indole-3-glycerol phosphate synthase